MNVLSKAEEKHIINRVARSAKELEEAYSLVHNEYKRVGLVAKRYKASRLRISILNANPETTTFVATYRSNVIATVTVIPDSPLGLPMEKVYKKEIDALRKQRLKLVEVSQFAISASLFPKGWYSLFNFDKLIFIFRLFKVVLDYVKYVAKVDEVCICVMPCHEYLYNFIQFKNFLKKPKRYPAGNNKLVIAKHLSLNTVEDRFRLRKGLYSIFFGKKTPPDALKGKRAFTKQDLEHFFVKRTDVFQKASPERMAFIRQCYPAGMVDDILFKHGIEK